eukprot:COSAG02_NODE_1330_length_13218_cov_8.247504_7_plen_73_part_00
MIWHKLVHGKLSGFNARGKTHARSVSGGYYDSFALEVELAKTACESGAPLELSDFKSQSSQINSDAPGLSSK